MQLEKESPTVNGNNMAEMTDAEKLFSSYSTMMEPNSISVQHRFTPLPIYKFLLVINDIVTAVGAFFLGLWLTGSIQILEKDWGATVGFVILSLTSISFFQTYRLYSYHFFYSRKRHFNSLFKSFCWSTLTLSIVLFLFNSPSLLHDDFYVFISTLLVAAFALLFLSRYLWSHALDFVMALGMAFIIVGMTGMFCKNGIPVFMTNYFVITFCFTIAVILLITNRVILVHVVLNNWLRRHFRRKVVIVGVDSEADKIARHIVENNAPFWIEGTVGTEAEKESKNIAGKEHLGVIDLLPEITKKFRVDDLIITDEKLDKATLVALLDFCTSIGINAWFSPKLLPIINVKLVLDNFCGLSMIRLCSQKHTWLFNRIKHLVDVVITLPIFMLVSPLYLLIAMAIKLDSPGPVFYRAEAVGKNGRIFSMFKFRSMQVNSDSKIHKDYVSKLIKGEIEVDKEKENGQPIKITDDPRVTRVGKILRKMSLDELPQLINVLKKDMSLVGPRPCLPYEFEIYQDWYKKRTSIRPGITGLWQVTGRSEVSIEDMMLLDLYYVYNRTLGMDFNILFETIFVVLGKKGAY